MKKILILALSAGAMYILYKVYKKDQDKDITVKPAAEEAPKVICPKDEITCGERNPNKCYNPNIRYIVDPCI
jgi:hypothetical protein